MMQSKVHLGWNEVKMQRNEEESHHEWISNLELVDGPPSLRFLFQIKLDSLTWIWAGAHKEFHSCRAQGYLNIYHIVLINDPTISLGLWANMD